MNGVVYRPDPPVHVQLRCRPRARAVTCCAWQELQVVQPRSLCVPVAD
eukprot:COSAG03_NODE_23984_length_275_cov_1.375000_1_plen_47_part_10